MSTPDRQPPPEISTSAENNAKAKAYAFERSLGIPPAAACRAAGGKVENGQATKWERNKRVQAWIAFHRSRGNTDEMLAAKRQRLEDRLNLAIYADLFEFSTVVDRVILIKVGEEIREMVVQTPVIDWNKVAASPSRVIVEKFKFDKDSGYLTDFERESAQQAAAQVRDMYGFKAPSKLSDPNGDPLGAGMLKNLVPVINLLGKPEGL